MNISQLFSSVCRLDDTGQQGIVIFFFFFFFGCWIAIIWFQEKSWHLCSQCLKNEWPVYSKWPLQEMLKCFWASWVCSQCIVHVKMTVIFRKHFPVGYFSQKSIICDLSLFLPPSFHSSSANPSRKLRKLTQLRRLFSCYRGMLSL